MADTVPDAMVAGVPVPVDTNPVEQPKPLPKGDKDAADRKNDQASAAVPQPPVAMPMPGAVVAEPTAGSDGPWTGTASDRDPATGSTADPVAAAAGTGPAVLDLAGLQPAPPPPPGAGAGASATASADVGAPATATADPDAAASQVAPALLTMASKPDGSSRLAVSLHPKDLGGVTIQLDRSADGAVKVTVVATEPTTLRSLMTDQAHLHAALDAAFIPTADRQLSFELTPPPTSPTSTDAGGAGGNGADLSGRNGGFSSGTSSGGHGTGRASNGALANDPSADPPPAGATIRLRSGSINITA